MSIFGRDKEDVAKISQLETQNTELLLQVNSKLKEIEELNNRLNSIRKEFQEADSKIRNLTIDNTKNTSMIATLQRENEKLVAHIKNIEESEERHERVLPALISANTAFTRTVMNIKVINAESMRKLKSIPEKYDFLAYNNQNSIHDTEQRDNMWKIFYSQGGNPTVEQSEQIRQRGIGNRSFSPYNIADSTHKMLEKFIVINRIIQEIEKITLEKTQNIKVFQAANEISEKLINKYAKNMKYFEYGYGKREWVTKEKSIIPVDPKMLMDTDALKALKSEAMTEEHVESLNRTTVKLFREVLFELNNIKKTYEGCMEINNLDIFSKQMYEMFKTFKQSLDTEIINISVEIKKYSELVNKLSNEEDVALNQTIKSLGIILQDSLLEEELIIKTAAKNMN